LEEDPPLTPALIELDLVKKAAMKTTEMISARIMGKLILIS
jgi:hypothetical protein